jgi:putative tricarboxylic transport membrane protein
MERLDRWSAIFWIVISGAVCIHSLNLGVGSFREPGVGFLFFWTGVILGGLSILLLVKGQRDPKRADSKGQGGFFKGIDWVKVGAVLAALVIYAVLFEWLGALISTAVFMGILIQTIEPKKWTVMVFLSLASSLSTYILFKVLLNVRLPSGFLGF